MPRLRQTSQEGGIKKSWILRRTLIAPVSERQKQMDRLSRLLKAAALRLYHNHCVGPLTTYYAIFDTSPIFPNGKYPLSRSLLDHV